MSENKTMKTEKTTAANEVGDQRLVLLLGKSLRWLAVLVAASAALYALFAYVITVEGMPFHWRVIAWVGVWLTCDIYGLRFKQNSQDRSSRSD